MRTCNYEGCNKKHNAKGYCYSHYRHLALYGEPRPLKRQGERLCDFEGCDRRHVGRGYCRSHLYQLTKTGNLAPIVGKTDPTNRDPHGRKLCVKCRDWQFESEFGNSQSTPDNLASYCRTCTRDAALWSNYRLRLSDYEAMSSSQGGRCAICDKQPGSGKPLFVDHDHSCCPGYKSCGKCVRKLLCSGCNFALGSVDDNIEVLENAIRYLKEYL